MMDKKSKILVLGCTGLIGSAIVRELKEQKFENILVPPRDRLDLSNQQDVMFYFRVNQPEYVFMAASKSHGIQSKEKYPADFIFQNISMQNNVFHAGHENGIKRLIYIGNSSCYPASSHQPIKEEYLLTGKLDEANEPFALANIVGIKTAESFRRQYGLQYFSLIANNVYGIGDNFNHKTGKVIPSLISRMQEVMDNGLNVCEALGTGVPQREFLYADDMAKAAVLVMNSREKLLNKMPPYINIGPGESISIKKVAELIAKIIGFDGEIKFNPDYPDGPKEKLLDNSQIKSLGWVPTVSLEEGIKKTVDFFQEKLKSNDLDSNKNQGQEKKIA